MTLDPREDLHALMAVRLYCVPLLEVTPELRAKAKLYTFGWRVRAPGARNSERDIRADRVRQKVGKNLDAGNRLRGVSIVRTATTRRRQALVLAFWLFGNMLDDRGSRLRTRQEWLACREVEREGSTHPCTCWHGLRCMCRGTCSCHYTRRPASDSATTVRP